MAQRKPKLQTHKPDVNVVVGIGWYDREQWAKLKQVSADADKLDITYEDWLRNAERSEREISRGGLTVRRVMVNIDSLLAWCLDKRKQLNSESRATYVTELVQGIR